MSYEGLSTMRATQTAYILAVNAQILADTGGPCSHKDCNVRISS